MMSAGSGEQRAPVARVEGESGPTQTSAGSGLGGNVPEPSPSTDTFEEEGTMDADREREIRDNQTYVVMLALERVLVRYTDSQITKAILDDLLDEVKRGE